jgi:hypothetical protein
MDSLSILKAEMERKRKVTEPLRDAVALATDSGSAADATNPVQEKKKKVYLTNGQAKKLQAELLVRVSVDDAALGSNSNAEGNEVGPLSPEQISAHKSAVEGKKIIPRTEVFKRLR